MTRWLALALLAGLIVAGCTAVDYHPPPVDPVAPGHDGSNGSGSGGSGM
jgi:hypothetical protein